MRPNFHFPAAPTLTIEECDAPPPPQRPRPQPADARLLLTPCRAETKLERLRLARRGVATGSFKFNCAETPFLCDAQGLDYITRIALGLLAPPPPPPSPVEAPAPPSPVEAPAPVLLARPVRAAVRARTRPLSLDISWPRKLGAAVLRDMRVQEGQGMPRSATVKAGLCDVRAAAEYFAAPAARRAVYGVPPAWRADAENCAPSAFRAPPSKKGAHARAQSLDGRPRGAKSPLPPAEALRPSRFSTRSSSSSLSRTFSASASTIRKLVLRPLNRYLDHKVAKELRL